MVDDNKTFEGGEGREGSICTQHTVYYTLVLLQYVDKTGS